VETFAEYFTRRTREVPFTSDDVLAIVQEWRAHAGMILYRVRRKRSVTLEDLGLLWAANEDEARQNALNPNFQDWEQDPEVKWGLSLIRPRLK
jgi:hypothetical protein